MRNCQSPQLLLDREEVRLVASRQCHGDRGCWQVSPGALARSVDQLRSEDSTRKILPNDAIVGVRPTGVEPARPRVLTPGLHPNGQTPISSCEASDTSENSWKQLPAPGGATEAVKLAWAEK